MSKQKGNDDSKKASQAATNPAFADDENLTEPQEPQNQEEQTQEKPAEEQQKDTIKVPERDDKLDDSGVFSPDPPGATASTSEKFVYAIEDSNKEKLEKSPSSTRGKRSPSLDRLKAGAETFYRNIKEVVKTALRSSSSSPKKEADETKQERPPPSGVKEEASKKKRSLSMISMASIETETTDSELDSGMTVSSNLPESETFDKGVCLPSDQSVDNLPAAEGVEEMAMNVVPEADESQDVEMETDLPESDMYKLSDVKKDGDRKDTE